MALFLLKLGCQVWSRKEKILSGMLSSHQEIIPAHMVPNPLITNISKCSVFLIKRPLCQVAFDHSTCVHTVVGFQLVLEAEFLPTAVTFIGLLPGVDAFVALQRALISKAAPAELTLVWVVPCCKVEKKKQSLLRLTDKTLL